MNSVRASLIIATHSRPQLLPRAVRSALSAGTDVEVVIVDDASTDETAQVCRQLAAQHENVVVVRSETNLRVAGARNLGLLRASGRYLGFLDDDDIRMRGPLDKQIELLEQNPKAGWCYGLAFTGDEECRPHGVPQPDRRPLPEGDIFWELLERNFLHCLTVIFRREAFQRAGLLDENLPGVDDWDYWLRLAEREPVVAYDAPVAVWREATPGSDQGTSEYAALLSRAAEAQQTKWLKMARAKEDAPRAAAAAGRCLDHFSDMLLWKAGEALKAGYKQQARENTLTALRLRPGRSLRPRALRLLASSVI
jgi:glycosyltransferase involved in cell wall biosynthesis